MNYIQAEEEILPEPVLAYFFLQILVGRRNQANVDWNRLSAPHPLDFPFLKNTQELCLGAQAQVADFI